MELIRNANATEILLQLEPPSPGSPEPFGLSARREFPGCKIVTIHFFQKISTALFTTISATHLSKVTQ
jgi:hypothetical protein